jgi:hypothetical protein
MAIVAALRLRPVDVMLYYCGKKDDPAAKFCWLV